MIPSMGLSASSPTAGASGVAPYSVSAPLEAAWGEVENVGDDSAFVPARFDTDGSVNG